MAVKETITRAVRRTVGPTDLSQREWNRPTIATVLKAVRNSVARLYRDPVGKLLGSAFFLIMVWGYQGNLEVLTKIVRGWTGPGSTGPRRGVLIPGLPWDQEWISFAAGFLLLVVLPMCLIKWVFHQRLTDYGLGLPEPGRRKFAALSAFLLFLGCLPGFILATRDPQMRAVYPLHRSLETLGQFAVYEAGYLLFFIAIEFIFRGYLIFGLYRVKDAEPAGGIVGEEGPLVFGYYSILISMLSYTAWHLGKPPLETWGTLFWGLVAGPIVLISRSIWPIVAVHYLLNVLMDYRIWSTR